MGAGDISSHSLEGFVAKGSERKQRGKYVDMEHDYPVSRGPGQLERDRAPVCALHKCRWGYVYGDESPRHCPLPQPHSAMHREFSRAWVALHQGPFPWVSTHALWTYTSFYHTHCSMDSEAPGQLGTCDSNLLTAPRRNGTQGI